MLRVFNTFQGAAVTLCKKRVEVEQNADALEIC